MFYYLYEIRNNLNGKIYVGVHKTKDMNDGYMGSGKVIKRDIEKHGIENFTKVILETFEDTEAMYAREKEVVTEEFLSRDDVYNLRRGGFGGFEYINKEGKNHIFSKDESIRGARSMLSLMTPEERSKKAKHARSFNLSSDSWKIANAASRTIEAIQKRKETFSKIGHQQKENNSGWGKMWITNEIECRKIKKTDPVPEGWRKGRHTAGVTRGGLTTAKNKNKAVNWPLV